MLPSGPPPLAAGLFIWAELQREHTVFFNDGVLTRLKHNKSWHTGTELLHLYHSDDTVMKRCLWIISTMKYTCAVDVPVMYSILQVEVLMTTFTLHDCQSSDLIAIMSTTSRAWVRNTYWYNYISMMKPELCGAPWARFSWAAQAGLLVYIQPLHVLFLLWGFDVWIIYSVCPETVWAQVLRPALMVRACWWGFW